MCMQRVVWRNMEVRSAFFLSLSFFAIVHIYITLHRVFTSAEERLKVCPNIWVLTGSGLELITTIWERERERERECVCVCVCVCVGARVCVVYEYKCCKPWVLSAHIIVMYVMFKIQTLACPLLREVSAFWTLIWTKPATMKDTPAITIPTTILCRGLELQQQSVIRHGCIES